MTKKNPEQEAPDRQAFFMRITNPNIFRKELLESSKMTLSIMRQVYTVNQIRKTKHELMSLITKEIKELKILINKINELMPTHKKDDLKKMFPQLYIEEKLPEKHEEKPERKEGDEPAKPEEAKPKSQPPHELSELGKVTKALDEVQRRLQNL